MNKSPRGYNFGARATWETYKMGGFICWTNNIPFGTDVYVTNRANPVFDVTGFAPSSVDVDDWISSAASIGLEYLTLTVKHNMGWWLFPFSTDMEPHTGKDSYNTTISLPQVANYGVNNASIVGTADQDIVHRFVSGCIANGIKPILYYNIGKDINARGGFSSIQESAFSSDSAISSTYSKYTTMVEAHITELLQTFPTIHLWLDAVAWYPRSAHQSLFNTIRSAGSENNLVIYNYQPVQGSSNTGTFERPSGTSTDYEGSLVGESYYLWPFDIISHESSFIPTGAGQTTAWLAALKANKKHIYWTGAELETTIFAGQQYFYYDPIVVGGTPNVLESAANLNAIADIVTPSNVPFSLTWSPDLTGVISTAQKNRMQDVYNHIFP